MKRLIVSLFAIAGAACVAERRLHQVPIDARLPWLVPGTTKRGDIEQRLGRPALELASDRTVVWGLVPGEAGELQPRTFQYSPWRTGGVQVKDENELSLVVVFDAQQLASRASLVRL